MFGFSLATQIFQGSTQRTWNCVSHLANLIWGKFNYIRKETMPRSRKRHHSRSRSRSRSFSRDRSYDRHKKIDSHEKDGKRRKVDDVDSPQNKRSISSERHDSTENEVQRVEDVNEQVTKVHDKPKAEGNVEINKENTKFLEVTDEVSAMEQDNSIEFKEKNNEISADKNLAGALVLNVEEKKSENKGSDADNETIEKHDTDQDIDVSDNNEVVSMLEFKDQVTEQADEEVNRTIECTNGEEEKTREFNTVDVVVISESDSSMLESKTDVRGKLTTPKSVTPKQIQKKLESEKKKLQRQKEREEREREKQEEKAKILAEKERIRQQKEAEKQKLLEEKQKLQEQRQKEKEMKEEQKRKEKEEKEQKRKEKEEQEAQKRKEKELEKLKKQQDIEEKNKEKQREEEKKQKTAAMFVGFFKKTETEEKEKKTEKANCNFMPFEIKSDMRLPPLRRSPLGTECIKKIDLLIENQDENASYLNDLKSGVIKIGKTFQTWPYEDLEDEVTIIEDDKILGETICEKMAKTPQNLKAKFLLFHDNRRPAYFGTWRKKSKFIKPRRPFEEDRDIFNYDEDSDDDWEEEEQGESLDVSGDEDDKENDAEDDYEVDNEFFVPHGHLSDDEIDDEENARLSPESLKQKLKLLKDEFDEEIKSKTHKLKPRSIGCIWYNNNGDNVEDAIKKYLQPFAMIVNGQIEIKKRSEIFTTSPEKKKLKTSQELPREYIPHFLKIIHGNVNKMKIIIEQFLTYMGNNGLKVEISKANLTRFLRQIATYKKCKENGPMKNKFGWFVNDGINEKYDVILDLSKTENSSC